ncbi:MAG: ABC transporter permease [Eubacterium sp.]|nr:ABC transporter permease [Eubacterium sp.]
MKELNARIPRELKTHLGRYLALFFMIVMGMYLVVSIAGMAETTIQGSDAYNKECKLQNGQFTVFTPLTDAQIRELEDGKCDLESIFSVDITAEKGTLRIFKPRENIDLLKTDDGSAPTADHDIVIMNLYADRNKIHIGDRISLAGEEFTVSGIGCIPDYNLPVKSFSDMTADPENFGIAVVSSDAYDKLLASGKTGGETFTYAYRLKDGATHRTLKDALKELTIDSKVPGTDSVMKMSNLESFSENKDNPRIASDAASDVILKRLVSLVAGAILVMLFAYVISVFIIHQINEESSVIGTLYSMGVKRSTLTLHYILLPTVITFIAGLIGMLLGFSPVGVDFQMQDSYLYYSIPKMEQVYPLYIILYCIVMPPLISILVNTLVILKKLSRTALSLIKNEQEHLLKRNRGTARVNGHNNRKGRAFLLQFTKRQMSREKRGVFTVVIGMTVALLIFMIGLNCHVLCNNVKTENLADINYEYMYLLKYPTEQVPEGAEPCLVKNLSVNYLDYSLDVNVIGIDQDNPYYPFHTSGNKKDLVIASSTAQKYDLSVGDTFIMDDTAEDIRYAFNVSEIVPYSIGLTAYMDIDSMRELFGESKDYYNMLVSDKPLSIESSHVYSITQRSDVENAAGIFVDQMMSLVIILIAVSVLIFIAVMYLMLNVMIDRAAFGISLVKIFGYRMKEIRRVYLDGNFYAVMLGACIIIPLVKLAADSIYPFFIANTAMGMNLHFEWYLYVGVFLGILAVYLIISSILTHKIKKIVPAEVLKNRE